MGTTWKMPIAVIGKPTGDGRQFDPGALAHRDLPLPFRYVAEDSGGHNNAVIVGHISKIGKEKDGMLPAQGEFYDDESWPEDVRNAAIAAKKFTANKVIGPSVDLDQAEMERVPEPKAYAVWKKEQAAKLKAVKMAHAAKSGSDCGCGADPVMAEEPYDGPSLRMVRSGRVASATLVHIPAFAELAGHATLIDTHDPNTEGTTAAITPARAAELGWTEDIKIENDDELAVDPRTGLLFAKKKKLDPEKVKGNDDDEVLANESGIWLSDADFEEFAKRRLPSPNKNGQAEPTTDAEQGQSGGSIGGGTYAPDVTKAGVRNKLDAADFVDPDGRRFPIATCADIPDAVSSYGRANPKIPYAKFKARLTAIAKRKGCEGSLPDDWKAGEKMAALMASAGTATFAPARSAFDDPQLSGPSPVHINHDDRTLSGHVAIWETCHVGIGSSCVKPPKSNTGYAYFHTGELRTDDGSPIAVGRLTYGGGHAKPNLGYAAAAEHYDQTSNVGAYVRAGEDAYGIWVAGVLAPEADDAAIRQMSAAPLSGDWRRVGGNLEMVAALHVNTAGFPIPRMLTASADETELFSLVAAGALPRVIDDADSVTASTGEVDYNELGRAIARGIAEQQQAAAEQQAKQEEWASLVAAAKAAEIAYDYDEAVGELMAALAEE